MPTVKFIFPDQSWKIPAKTFLFFRFRWRYVEAEGGRVVGVGAGHWRGLARYRATNGPDSPALYVSITNNTILPF